MGGDGGGGGGEGIRESGMTGETEGGTETEMRLGSNR